LIAKKPLIFFIHSFFKKVHEDKRDEIRNKKLSRAADPDKFIYIRIAEMNAVNLFRQRMKFEEHISGRKTIWQKVSKKLRVVRIIFRIRRQKFATASSCTGIV
jgi:hypothetical protein